MTDRTLPTAVCPACRTEVPLGAFTAEGFLRARGSARGGPFYELSCPACETVLVMTRGPDRSRRVTVKRTGGGLRGQRVPPNETQWFAPEEEPQDPDPQDGRRRDDAASDASRPGADPGSGGARGANGRTETGGARRRADADPPRRWLEALGLEALTSAEAVQAAFRARSKRVHPDRFQQLDEEFRALAHEKFIELKRARDGLLGMIERRTHRGEERRRR